MADQTDNEELSKEDLKKEIVELKKKVERLENSEESSKHTENIEENKEAEESNISRRRFMKAIGGGAAGLGVASLLPSAAAFDITSDQGFNLYSSDSDNPGFSVDSSGKLMVKANESLEDGGGIFDRDGNNRFAVGESYTAISHPDAKSATVGVDGTPRAVIRSASGENGRIAFEKNDETTVYRYRNNENDHRFQAGSDVVIEDGELDVQEGKLKTDRDDIFGEGEDSECIKIGSESHIKFQNQIFHAVDANGKRAFFIGPRKGMDGEPTNSIFIPNYEGGRFRIRDPTENNAVLDIQAYDEDLDRNYVKIMNRGLSIESGDLNFAENSLIMRQSESVLEFSQEGFKTVLAVRDDTKDVELGSDVKLKFGTDGPILKRDGKDIVAVDANGENKNNLTSN